MFLQNRGAPQLAPHLNQVFLEGVTGKEQGGATTLRKNHDLEKQLHPQLRCCHTDLLQSIWPSLFTEVMISSLNDLVRLVEISAIHTQSPGRPPSLWKLGREPNR